MKASVRGTELYFDVDGVGLIPDGPRMREKPVMFLIHGGPGFDHGDAKLGCAPLAQKAQLVYFDQRGHGRSAPCDPETYNLNESVEDLEALRRHLGFGPIVSMGTSYGGMVAMAHAARYPASVSQLILVVTASHSGYLERARQTVEKRGSAEQIAQFQAMLAGEIDSVEGLKLYSEVMASLYGLSVDRAQLKTALDRTVFAPEAFRRAYMPGGFLRNFDLRPELKRVTAPTLILAGRHDWICPPDIAEEMHALIPDSDLRIFENSSHYIRADARQEFLDVVTGFLVYKTRTRAQ